MENPYELDISVEKISRLPTEFNNYDYKNNNIKIKSEISNSIQETQLLQPNSLFFYINEKKRKLNNITSVRKRKFSEI